ncbi:MULTISPECIES: energy transducer TonB [unclassified Flavobacterium]|uniref:energy transducer TonB n=1 Tax=unclassified Flavobacterium TaxID=196869 RepID=UPI0009DD9976|nr:MULTISPECIES: energy transducer TonB [unclassified Flavobacterium]MEA9411704.1 energy transducer TonB [Flavobacterium sp. PL02]
MKKFLLLILICFVQNTFSQTIKEGDKLTVDASLTISIDDTIPPQGTIPNDDYLIYNTAGIEVKPEFPGGLIGFDSFIKQNYKNPTDNLKGKIYVTFIIEKDGSLSDIKILRDIGYGTGAEAIRVLKTSPKWTPGIQNNKQVRVLYSLPIIVN